MATYAGRTLIKIKTAKMYNNITVDRLEQIERDREQTMADVAYQRWMKDLQVGSRYIDRGLIHNANLAMQDWDASRFRVPDIKV
jgi:hypothetical protein